MCVCVGGGGGGGLVPVLHEQARDDVKTKRLKCWKKKKDWDRPFHVRGLDRTNE